EGPRGDARLRGVGQARPRRGGAPVLVGAHHVHQRPRGGGAQAVPRGVLARAALGRPDPAARQGRALPQRPEEDRRGPAPAPALAHGPGPLSGVRPLALLPALIVALATVGHGAGAAPSSAVPVSPALPDTGIFAPVAAQLRAR